MPEEARVQVPDDGLAHRALPRGGPGGVPRQADLERHVGEVPHREPRPQPRRHLGPGAGVPQAQVGVVDHDAVPRAKQRLDGCELRDGDRVLEAARQDGPARRHEAQVVTVDAQPPRVLGDPRPRPGRLPRRGQPPRDDQLPCRALARHGPSLPSCGTSPTASGTVQGRDGTGSRRPARRRERRSAARSARHDPARPGSRGRAHAVGDPDRARAHALPPEPAIARGARRQGARAAARRGVPRERGDGRRHAPGAVHRPDHRGGAHDPRPRRRRARPLPALRHLPDRLGPPRTRRSSSRGST